MMITQIDQHQVLISDGGKNWLPSQPWIVLLHGAQNDHSVWHAQAKALATAGWNVVAPDLPAHGQSDGSPKQSIQEMAAWTARLLSTLGISQAVLAGHSMGSLIALELAVSQKNLCLKLLLLGTALPMPVAPSLLNMCQEQASDAIRLIAKWSHNPGKVQADETAAASISGRLLALMESIHQNHSAAVLPTDMHACNDYQPDFTKIEELYCPVHLIAGEADKMTSLKAAQSACTRFRHAVLHVIPAAGHALMTESAPETTKIITDILKINT